MRPSWFQQETSVRSTLVHRVRRFPSAAGLVVAAVIGLLASPGYAQEFDALGASTSGPAEARDQSWAFEVRFGPYFPDVDDGLNGTPFQDHHGSDSNFMFGAEVDWQAYRIPSVGTLGPGFGFGWTSYEGARFLPGTEINSAETTEFNFLPMYLVAVLRVDELARRTSIPIVPYVKAGFGYALWWSTAGDNLDTTRTGDKLRDNTFGTQLALGAMLLLDIFDRRASKRLESSNGVFNSYLFFEWYNAKLDGFGSEEKIHLGTNTWFTGLALEL